ncbi:MAG: VWA domain-containing protein [Gemmatimonadota bacterium]
MTLDSPTLLLLVPLLGAAIGVLAGIARTRRVRLASTWSAALGERARRMARGFPLLLGLATAIAALSLAGPRFGRAEVTTESRSLSLVLAVDISRSMLAQDVAPSRLGRASAEARRLVQDLPGDRIGLIAFAGKSYILSPLTVDGSAVMMFLDGLDPDLASEGGTDLAAVLRQGRELLETAERGAERVLVIFTDGEGHDSLAGAVAQAEALRAAGIRSIFVAEGGTEPVTIPLGESGAGAPAVKLDLDGQPVKTARRDDILQALAEASRGEIVRSETVDQAGAVRNLVRDLTRARSMFTRAADLIPRGWVAVLAGTLLLLVLTVARRSGALVAIAGLMLAASTAEAQRPSAGMRALARGDTLGAGIRFLTERSGGRDTAYYNGGTVLLKAGQYDEARKALEAAARSIDPGLRYRALYNLGTLALLEARKDSARRDTLLAESVERLKEALRLMPGAEQAKWNLELAQRRRTPPQSGGGGSPPPRPSSGGNQPRPPSQSELDQAQAEQILSSMDRQERATREAQQRRMRTRSSGTKDW